MESDSVKKPVVTTEDYTIYLEEDCGFWFIHCDCQRWTNSIRKKMLNDLEKIQKDDLFAIHEHSDKKHEKFLRLFKFAFLKDFTGLDGKLRQLYIRRILWV